MKHGNLLLLAAAALSASSCWFPGNPMGYSSNSEPALACPVSFPEFKSCRREKMQFCAWKGVIYECYETAWHPSALARSDD